MARRVAKWIAPTGTSWVVTASLEAPDGTVMACMVELRWNLSWARDGHHGAVGHALKGAMRDALLRAGLDAGSPLP